MKPVLLALSLSLSSYALQAKEAPQTQSQPSQPPAEFAPNETQFTLGILASKIDGFSGEGYQLSFYHDLFDLNHSDRTLPEGKFYVKANYFSATEDDNRKSGDAFFKQSELLGGWKLPINEQHEFFAELGYLEQEFDVNNGIRWQQQGDLYRLGFQSRLSDKINLRYSLEHHNLTDNDTGVSLELLGADNQLSLFYKKVGDFQSYGVNYNLPF
ncbi:hypothetical protein SG34_007235 [Thalassomonas viridans]|uniref:TonB-dependent receptor-like beta-barrel domain-containing protein n=1 Tax=Thalassomonas viridans TaxID=137584 RepID=A0AAF0CAU1_9GAMM|nr:hypothetical protein [Thalassomonas viridans]WDE06690.1 hypothetical protein SG34_007235 [Thalassomonas viridans]